MYASAPARLFRRKSNKRNNGLRSRGLKMESLRSVSFCRGGRSIPPRQHDLQRLCEQQQRPGQPLRRLNNEQNNIRRALLNFDIAGACPPARRSTASP